MRVNKLKRTVWICFYNVCILLASNLNFSTLTLRESCIHSIQSRASSSQHTPFNVICKITHGKFQVSRLVFVIALNYEKRQIAIMNNEHLNQPHKSNAHVCRLVPHSQPLRLYPLVSKSLPIVFLVSIFLYSYFSATNVKKLGKNIGHHNIPKHL